MSRADVFDNTLLHLACLFYHGDLTLIECLLSTGKTDPLCVNYYGETPLKILSLSSKEHSQLNICELIKKFGKTKVSRVIESYVNVVVLGDPGVGKSTLVKVLNDRHDVLLGRFRSVSGVELCTAGIVPHILNDKDMGRIIIHDLAGQVEYYSSHTAVLENLLQGSAAVFVIVVSLADNELAINSLRFWMSVVDNVSYKALRQCQVMVVSSYADLPEKSPKTLQSILDKHSFAESSSSSLNHAVYHNKIVSLDCRKLGGDGLTSFITTLSITCQTLRDDSVKEMSLYCHILYDLLTSSTIANAMFLLRDLINLIEQKKDVYLPTDVTQLFDIIHSLSSTGLIVYLGKIADPDRFWIIFNKSALLRELNGVLFAPKDFKEHVSTLVSDTGIVKVSKLSSLFPKYDIEILVYFLEYMHLSQEISEHFLLSSNLSPPIASAETTILKLQERYLFIPALIKSTNKPKGELLFQFGWALECSEPDNTFVSRFIHLLLLHVFAKYTEQDSIDPMDKACHIWNNGIYWSDGGGFSSLLEVFNNNQHLILLMSFQKDCVQNMIAQRKTLIEEILLAKGKVLPETPVNEFIIDNSNDLLYPEILEYYRERLSFYSIVQVAQRCLDGKPFVVTKNNNKAKVAKLLNGEVDSQELFDSVFAGRNPENMVKGDLSLPLKATLCTVGFKQDEPPILVNIQQAKPQSSSASSVGAQHVSSTDANTSITDQQVDPSICTASVNTQPTLSLTNAMITDPKDLANGETEITLSRALTCTNAPPTSSVPQSSLTSSVGTQHVSLFDANTSITNQQVDPSISMIKTQPTDDQTLSIAHQDDRTANPYIRIIRENTPQILGIISDPKKLSTELWSHDLLSLSMKDSVHTTTEISRYTRTSMIMDEVIRFFEQIDDSENFLKFCDVLVNHGQPGLDRIANEMLSQFKNNCTNQVKSEDSNTSLSTNRDENRTVNETERNRDGNTVNETERNKDGDTVNETKRNRDGDTVNETERNKDSDTVNETERNRDGNTVNETERNRDGNTVNKTERNRDGNTVNETERNRDGNTVNA